LFSYFPAVAVPFAVFVIRRRGARGPAPEDIREDFPVPPPTSPLGAAWTTAEDGRDAESRPRHRDA